MDSRLRMAVFSWLKEQVDLHGDMLPRALLSGGFQFEGLRVPLVSPQGIFKPRLARLPLTITTTSTGPYKDSFSDYGLLRYCYRKGGFGHRDNAGLRTLMAEQVPLVYFHGIVPGKYLAVWPVFIVGDHPESEVFTVAVDDVKTLGGGLDDLILKDATSRRAYVTAAVRKRLHQRTFRERVLRAYRTHCAMCRLGHEKLLDAAHIIPDSEPEGVPAVSNGLALCKIHHAAFDANFLGITPDFRILVREDIRREEDGPMLLHGLQGMHGRRIILPRSAELRPSQDRLAARFERFQRAG
ncbi:MAG: HNH endonuclease [Planctomycetota bacterium]